MHARGGLLNSHNEKVSAQVCKGQEVGYCTPNSLTLDTCDYYFDGVLQEKNGYVLNITERANALGRPVEIHQDYFFKVKQVHDTLSLVCETPEIFAIKVNDREVMFTIIP